jgi:PAS domain S-box-containing protein
MPLCPQIRLRSISLSTSVHWVSILVAAVFLVVYSTRGVPRTRDGVRPKSLQTGILLASITLDATVLTPFGIPDSSHPAVNTVFFPAPPSRNKYQLGIEALAVLIVLESLWMTFLLIERRRRKLTHESLGRRLALEQQISELSTRFAGSSPDQIDNEIHDGLERIRNLLGADRAYWYQNPSGSTDFECVYYACSPGVAPPAARVRRDELPSVIGLLLAGSPVRLDKVADLPATAVRERAFFEKLNTKSVVLVPADAGRNAKGLLGISSATAEKEWASDLISQLGVLSFVIASVVQRKKAQLARQVSEHRFSRLFEDASVGIALEGPEGRLLSVNPAFCSMTGYTKEELLQLSCANLSHPEDAPSEMVLFEELCSGKRKSYQMEKRFFRKDASVFWAHINISLLKSVEGPPLVIGMAKDISERKASDEQLTAAKLELQHLTTRLIQAQDNERRRISQELHDDIGQRLSLLTVDLDTLQQELDSLGIAFAARRASDLHRFACELGSDIHHLSHELHSSKLQHLGLASALKDLCEKVSAQNQLAITCRANGLTNGLPSDVALCLFRVAQEALNNVLKHSNSRKASVETVASGHAIALKIADWGRGFDPTRSHWGIGLSSMRERLRAVGGEFTVRSSPGKGTEIIAEVKLEQAAAAKAGGY